MIELFWRVSSRYSDMVNQGKKRKGYNYYGWIAGFPIGSRSTRSSLDVSASILMACLIAGHGT